MVEVSNPTKVMFPADGLTKRDVVDHYASVGAVMMPHVSGRPITLHRFPNGIGAKGFLQKNASEYFPASIRRLEVPKREGGTTTYPLVDEPDDLAYLANQGTITFHIWTSREPELDHPDRIVFDLDPPKGETAAARAAAHHVRTLLHEIGLDHGVPMTTGSNGYHVVVPIEPNVPVDRLAEGARAASEILAARHPDTLTSEFRIQKRQGRVFVDWLRNRFGQTGVAPWSLRARTDAPVAVPIGWDELDDTEPDRWTLRTVGDRIGTDPLADAARSPVDSRRATGHLLELASTLGIELEPFDRFRS